ncbi:MAG: acyl-CoA/acyl-ACP dehydrogenase [Deltaproteobacteria bacterium]|nr:acyl-CoA/acyl-ACP dehydrogenase [Deltaproteobacteria bacterium]
MNFSFTEEETQIREETARFARERILPLQGEIEKCGVLPESLDAEFRGLGIVGLPFPEEDGGLSGTFTSMILAVRELAYASMVPPNMVLENFVLAWPLWAYGSEELKKTYLPGLFSMESVGALAFTEPDTGSDPRQLKTTAVKAEGGWVLNGTKRFITYSGICDQMILFAKTGEMEVAAFLVERGKPGYKAGKRESFSHMQVDNGDVILQDYFAPDPHLIGAPAQGFEILLKSESLGKIGFCAIYAGAANRAVDLALSYATTRTHRGKPIGLKFQMIQEKIARMAVMAEALNSHLFRVCAKVDEGSDILFDAAVLKILTANTIRRLASDVMEIHGAYGLSDEYEASRIYALAAGAPVVMGALDLQRVIVARTLLAAGRYEG